MRISCLVVVAMLAAAGCGGGSAASASGGSTQAPADGAGWKPLLTLAELGTFDTRCGRRGGHDVFAASFTVAAMTATSTVSVSIDGRRVTRRVLQPGQRISSPLEPAGDQIWRISQATEPQTITAVVRIRPSRCPYGVPATDVRYGTTHVNSA